MYTLAIVDDEAMIRQGLSTIVNWKQLGFDLVGVYEDGEEIIRVLEDSPLDAVLCDIKMKTTSGIEVAHYIYNHHLNTKIILLSAYQEFELAKQALQYRVYDYLLKPTDIGELKSRFTQLKHLLDEISFQKESMIRKNSHLSKSMSLIYDILFRSGQTDRLSGIDELDDTLYIHGNSQVFAYLLESQNSENSDTYHILCDTFASEKNHLVNVHIIERNPESYFLLAWGDLEIQNIDQFIRDQLNLISFTTRTSFRIIKSRSILHSNTGQPHENLTYHNQDIIEVVNRLIDQNISEKITLENLCQQIYMNPSYFSRYFKKKTAMNFSEYVLQRRIEIAKKLIRENNLYIYEICTAVGIKNYKYFHKVFKTIVGCSPMEYKEKHLPSQENS